MSRKKKRKICEKLVIRNHYLKDEYYLDAVKEHMEYLKDRYPDCDVQSRKVSAGTKIVVWEK